MHSTQSLRELEAHLARLQPPSTPEEAIAKSPRLGSRLKNRDFLQSASVIAGLATEQAFHSHQVRFDWAARVLATCATGTRRADRHTLERLLNDDFARLRLDAQEDPIEQPFVGRVVTRNGAFRVLAGVYDQSTAFTDLIVSAFESLRHDRTMEPLRRVRALLQLSDALLQRAGAEPWSIGPDKPGEKIDLPTDAELSRLGERVHFSYSELDALGIDASLLGMFCLTAEDRHSLARTPVGASPLERRPLWRAATSVIVLAPGSISAAVRCHLIDAVIELKLQRAMTLEMLKTQHSRLTECGFLQERVEEIVDHAGLPALDKLIEVSDGRFCHVLQTVDSFGGWPDRGFNSETPFSPAEESAFARSVAKARAAAKSADDYREGFTLWLAGGWGAGRSLSSSLIDRFPDWPVVVIEPADACILALGETGGLRDVMRLEAIRRKLLLDGFDLHHPGSWLNLYAFWLENAHDLLPPTVSLTPPVNIQFGLVKQAEIRSSAYKRWDRISLPHPRFGHGIVSRLERLPFSGELEPVYASIDAVRQQRLIGATVSATGVAWVEAIGPADRETLYHSWHAALLWWMRIWPLWTAWSGFAYSLIDIVISVDPAPSEDWAAVDDHQIDAAIAMWLEKDGVVRMHLGRDWHLGMMRTDNRSEVALAAALLVCAAVGTGRTLSRETALDLVRSIAPANVRHRHAREVTRVIEVLGVAGTVEPFQRMSQTAMTLQKYGKVWRVRSRDLPPEVRGFSDCVALVRSCLAEELKDLTSAIRCFDRTKLVVAALNAQQAAMLEARTWETTARATRAIHGEERDREFSQEQRNHINSVLRCSSLIAEFAHVEAAPKDGLTPGRMDMEELQAKVMGLLYVADLLPALIAGVQEPLLRVSASGDLQSDRSFSDTTLKSTAVQLHTLDRRQADENYGRQRPEPASLEGDESELADAIEAEYGVPHSVLREFAMGVAQIAISDGLSVCVRTRGELLQELGKDPLLRHPELSALVDRLTLSTRLGWADLPPGTTAGDFDVSKLDRPQSLIARPILAVNDDADPLLIAAPATIERALVHNLSGALGGDLQNRFWLSDKMRRFASRRGARAGLEFNAEVARAVAAHGLKTWLERPLSWCLNRKQSEELNALGDVDVLGVAQAESIVWVIEAKDLKLCRILGEVARRLANYRGIVDPKGRPDALLKHMRRVDYLRTNAADLGKQLGLERTPTVYGLVIVKSPQPMSQLTATFFHDHQVALLDRLSEIPWQKGWH